MGVHTVDYTKEPQTDVVPDFEANADVQNVKVIIKKCFPNAPLWHETSWDDGVEAVLCFPKYGTRIKVLISTHSLHSHVIIWREEIPNDYMKKLNRYRIYSGYVPDWDFIEKLIANYQSIG